MRIQYTIDDILQYIEDNNITRTKDLPSSYRNYIYKNNLSHLLSLIKEKKDKSTKEKTGNRLQDWYNFEKILPYLERWAEQEGTTIRQQAKEGCLLPEWKEYCKQHPEYINM